MRIRECAASILLEGGILGTDGNAALVLSRGIVTGHNMHAALAPRRECQRVNSRRERKGNIKMKRVHPEDLKEGQVKAVEYSKGDLIMIVSDPAWDMKGDLTRIPSDICNIIKSPSKNNIKLRQLVVDGNTHLGKMVLDEIAERGYFESDGRVEIEECVLV